MQGVRYRGLVGAQRGGIEKKTCVVGAVFAWEEGRMLECKGLAGWAMRWHPGKITKKVLLWGSHREVLFHIRYRARACRVVQSLQPTRTHRNFDYAFGCSIPPT